MGWLRDHLDSFVIPRLLPGFAHDAEFIEKSINSQSSTFSSSEITVMKNAWRSMKRYASGKKIILAGRDVWLFEVLARRENYPTLFIPHCSRLSVRDVKIEDINNSCLFDTGFVGSIPMNLGISEFLLLSSVVNSKQVFPHLSNSRQLALKIEKTPKYWDTARSIDGEIIQEESEPNEFLRAAQLTCEIYKSSAPKFITTPSPVGNKRRYSWMW